MTQLTDGASGHAASSLMAMLKTGTTDIHRQVEAEFPLLRADLTAEGYRDVLQRMYAFYAAVEARYDSVAFIAPADLWLEQRRKVPLLVRDLKSLGLTDADIGAIELVSVTPPLATIEELVGILYVTEGSTLGGQVMRRLLRQRLALADDQLNFFTAYGSNTTAMWLRFGAAAEQMITRSQFVGVLQSARSTFECMRTTLRQVSIRSS